MKSGFTRNTLFPFAFFTALTSLACSSASAAPSGKIIGGDPAATPSDYPWQVAVFSSRSDVYQTQYCGGTILSDRWILTAAHCEDDETTYVAAGIIDLNDALAGEVVKVEEWFVHPGFDPDTFDNDIALLRLEEPLDLARCGSNCQAIDTVTPENEATLLYEFALATISGWGDRDNTIVKDFPTILHYAEVQIVNCASTGYASDTVTYPVYPITSNMFCAGTPDYSRDTCQGDSGGPLVVYDTDMTPLLGGITSWGEGCAINNYPGVYTRVANYANWIEGTIEDNCCAATTVLANKISNSSDKKDEFLGSLEGWLLLGLGGLWWRRRLLRQ